MRVGRCRGEQQGGEKLHLETGRVFMWKCSSAWLGTW